MHHLCIATPLTMHRARGFALSRWILRLIRFNCAATITHPIVITFSCSCKLLILSPGLFRRSQSFFLFQRLQKSCRSCFINYLVLFLEQNFSNWPSDNPDVNFPRMVFFAARQQFQNVRRSKVFTAIYLAFCVSRARFFKLQVPIFSVQLATPE